MKISEMIACLNRITEDHGDLDILVRDNNDAPCDIHSLNVKEVLTNSQYPENYNMPKGFKFVNIFLI